MADIIIYNFDSNVNYPINYKDLNTTTEFCSEVKELYAEAESYLKKFKWCKTIIDCQLYTNIGKVFCIFLFEIENTGSPEDNFLWVVVGDIPFMYLDTFGARSTKEVIENYISLAKDWINAVLAHKGIDNCYPFKAKPNVEMARLLEKRISFKRYTDR